MKDRPSEENNLEPLDIESRPQSVVLSTRLDATLARDLAVLARAQGRRISDLLRDAAAAYISVAGSEKPRSFIELSSATQTLAIGPQPRTIGAALLSPEGQTIGAPPPRTGAFGR